MFASNEFAYYAATASHRMMTVFTMVFSRDEMFQVETVNEKL